MSDPTPQQLAEALGLKAGMHVAASRILKDWYTMPLWGLTSLIAGMDRIDHFWAEFGSLFFPSLLRTHSDNPYDPFGNSARYWSTLDSMVCSPYLARDLERFCRLCPQEGLAYFYTLCGRIVDLGDRQDITTDQRGEALSECLTLARTVMGALSAVVPVNVGGRLLQEKTVQIRPAVFAGFSELAPQVPASSPSAYRDCCAVLRTLWRGKEWPTLTWAKSRRDPLNSYVCELFAEEEYVEERCVDPAEGLEMSECAGCLRVRYCSRAHQEADWKTHKRLCFPPGW